MEIIDIHLARRRLASLVARAASAGPFVISKNGKPLARVEAVECPRTTSKKRLGFLEGQFVIPDDFDSMAAAPIARMFGIKRKRKAGRLLPDLPVIRPRSNRTP